LPSGRKEKEAEKKRLELHIKELSPSPLTLINKKERVKCMLVLLIE